MGEIISETTDIKIYKTRFWILAIFSLVSFLEAAVWGTFGAIRYSAEYAYGWHDSYIALLDAWGPINSVLFMIPFSYFNQKYGIRNGMLLTTLLLTVGTAARCMSMEETAFTYLASFAAILAGMTSSLTQSLPVMISATWFPPNERTTATAISDFAVLVSVTAMYLSPLIVSSETDGATKEQIKLEIRKLMLIHFSLSALLLVCVVVYFPSKPPKPPSISASREKIDYFKSIKVLLKSRESMFVLLTFTYSYGVPIIWMSIINFSLSCLGFNQLDTMRVAITAAIISMFTGIIASRVNDKFTGHMKTLIILLLSVASCFFLWLLLMTEKVISNPSPASVYAAVAGGFSASYATVPIVQEFAIEMSYPCPESSVGALSILMLDSNGILFLLLMMIPSECYRWISYVLLLSVCVPIFLLLSIKSKQARLDVDNEVQIKNSVINRTL